MDRQILFVLLAVLLIPVSPVQADRVEPYSVSIHLHGEKTDRLKQLLQDASTADAQRDSPPPSLALLEAIARDDVRKMKKILRAESFYAATIKIDLKDQDSSPRLYFSVFTGPPFLVRSSKVNITGPPLPEDIIHPGEAEILLVPGSRGTSTAILAAETGLLNYFRLRGYPAGKAGEREVVVDYADQSVSVTYQIDPGPRSVFARTIFVGLDDVREKFVRRQIPWLMGEIYSPEQIQIFRNRLARTGLFTTLLISTEEAGDFPVVHSDEAAPLRPLDVLVTLREREPHTVGLEAGYSTDIGFGGAVSWEDRNLFGHGELFRLRVFGSQKLYYAEGLLRIPTFLHPDQSLSLSVQPVYDHPKAYDSDRLRVSALIRREFTDALVLSGGTALTIDRVTQLGKRREFNLFSIPLSVQLKIGGDQPFNRAGALFLLQGEPYFNLQDGRSFFKTMVAGNFLFRLPSVPFLTALARVTAGSIPEADLEEIPADLRFYAGGANSIRGYSYQKVGPLVGKDPIGGLSLFTASLELNCRVIGEFGVAAFLDGGAAFSEHFPRFGDEIRWGTGGGLRYFTPIGPLGIDLGFPIDPRKFDSDFQVYISIAQIY